MMRALLSLFLCLLVSVASAQTFSPRWNANPGTQRYVFQQGMWPTSGYAGCVDTWIDGNNVAVNHGADSTLSLGDVDTEVLLMQWDISSIPDEDEVVKARLYMYMQSEGVAAASQFLCRVGRLWPTWDEAQATWQNRITATGWTAAGATDSQNNPTIFGVASVMNARWSFLESGWTPARPLYGGLRASFGFDSLYTQTSGIDVTYINVDEFDPDGSGVDSPRRIRLDVTEIVSGWHTGAWENKGMRISEYDAVAGSTVFKSSECGWRKSRPYLEVWVLHAETEVPDTVYVDTGSGGGGGGSTLLGPGRGFGLR